jgi:sugar fermentation stimulation protein A
LSGGRSLLLDADLEGRLIRRYKRFLADIETADGRTMTVHCPDPGGMRGLTKEGAAVRCSTSDNPNRKLPHTLEMIRVGRTWVGVNTGRANALVRRALEGGFIEGLQGYTDVRSEVMAEAGSRLDFRLMGHAEAPDAWLEVKSVTMAEGKRGRFPDSVTERGRKHVDLLHRLARDGERAVLLYLVQRADCESVEPADEIDPAYGEALRKAAHGGVEVHALRARVSPTRIRVEGALPVLL